MSQLANPLISIILPVRNREEFLHACIESIRAQSYPYWELLIYDDASTDETANISKEFAASDKRIHYFYFASNGATGRIKNEATRNCNGELICFMDSDDLWPEEKLSRQLAALTMYPDAGYSFTNGYNFRDSDGSILEYFYDGYEGSLCTNFFEDVCSGRVGIRLPTLMIRKAIVEKALPFRTDRLFTDFSFWSTVAHESQGVMVYDPLLKRRTHESNETSESWNSDYEEHTGAIIRYWQNGWLDKATAAKILFQLQLNWGAHCIEAGKHSEGRMHFRKAWKWSATSLIPLKKIVRSYFRKS